ncbi:NADPH:quinone reductase [Ramlibacter tataouinensis]|uniref:NADPH:quinone oxidoreductase n=1 Tax=Ramlibacter tataouinensis TaxID=94132 RepID=A0A127JTX0_9BURK|nr:NADPH:quinone reductase [Ramlibacter tataouinensis]AMO23343.1 NADPH:quinone oxidoreductase [Ramlibacter tataouinensis]
MRAACYERTGPAAEVLRLAELPDPVPGAGELRVKLAWSGVNPSDVKSRAGLRTSTLPFARIVPHSDGMGVIDGVGEGVDARRLGERVWVWNAAWGRPDGTAAGYVTLPQAQAVPLPANTPDEAGACLGIPALTAIHAVMAGGGVQGKRVLVAGGAGAVGHYAVQFARLLGARQVLATVSSAEKGRLASAAGADEVIDYKRDDAAAAVLKATGGSGVDRVVELDIAANGALDTAAIAANGDWVVYGSSAARFSLDFFPLIAKNVTARFFIVYHLPPAERAAATAKLTELLSAGRLSHNITHRVPLSDIVKAHQLVESGSAGGNVVVDVSA